MPLPFTAWGPNGTLASALDFPVWNGNGVSDFTANVSPSIVGDRADVVTVDSAAAVRIKRYGTDAQAGNGNRTELVPSNYSWIADWETDVPGQGYNATGATRKYRVSWMVPSSIAASVHAALSAAGSPFIICYQIHQIPDDNPADTSALGPVLATALYRDPFGKLWVVLDRNMNSDEETETTPGAANTRVWAAPFRFDRWHDFMIDVVWSYSTLGQLSVYLDRRLIHRVVEGPTCPNNSPDRGGGGMYSKMGVYTSASTDIIVYHRGMIERDHAAIFADMYPELPGAVPLERVSGPLSCLGA